MKRAISGLIFGAVLAVPAFGQDAVYVQIEAQRTLNSAQGKARDYAGSLENVTGYSLGNGWYGIALGPYAPADADRVLRELRRSGAIPGDSYIVTGTQFRQQFWPIGTGAETTAQPLPADLATGETTTEVAAVTPEPAPEPDPIQVPDETPRQARASEAALSREEKKELQIALQWAGYYNSAIDGAFGRGTRRSMQAWQEANNHEPTGVLTTGQRVELFSQYNAVLEGMNLQVVRDDAAGIEMQIPTGVVSFTEYQPPFARYDGSDLVSGAQVLLLSQEGDQTRMFGLYEILQTLEIVPTEGERSRNDRSFEINGANSEIETYIQAELRNGEIKGFALIWPAGDSERRDRVLAEMKDSFTRIDGVLDPAIAVPDENQSVDLLAGLEIRRPTLSRTGFYIDDQGTVLTTSEAVQNCERITLDTDYDASIAHLDDALGLAVLRPEQSLSPLDVAEFQTGVPRLQARVAVSGYPFGGVLSAPTMTFGTLADLRGLNGEEELKRLAMNAGEGDAGGPLFDNGGAVLGMLLPRPGSDDQVLPGDVAFALDTDTIIASLTGAGISVQTTDAAAYMAPETLTFKAADMTVLVSCW